MVYNNGTMKSATPDFPGDWDVTRVASRPEVPPLEAHRLPLEESIAVPPGRTVVVVNDAQRPTPTPWLLGRLDIDWRRDDLVVAVATGSHNPPSEAELAEIFGSFLDAVRPRLIVNSAGEDQFVSAGRTSRGTAVEINRCLEGAASVICLGSVEPHYFAGWTGGRKSLVPGLCSLETMRLNHRLAIEGGAPGDLEISPVHLDLEEGTRLVWEWLGGEHCTLIGANVVHHRERHYGFFAGPLLDTVHELAQRGREVYARRLERRYPVVVCNVDPPLDRDLYQALKAFENWKGAVSPGGTLILVAACRVGTGPPSFRQFMESSPALDSLLEKATRDYALGDHKLVNFLRYLESGRSVSLVAEEDLPSPAVALRVFYELDGALEAALATGGGEKRVLFVEDAGHLFPVF
jgi:nickel-dependent lactate racemase